MLYINNNSNSNNNNNNIRKLYLLLLIIFLAKIFRIRGQFVHGIFIRIFISFTYFINHI